MTVNFLPMLTGCFAMPAAENPTVAMVEAAYRHHDIAARYINCEVPAELLGDAVRGARAMGWAGFNCSLPHKVAVIDHLDGLGEFASLIGAVNTIVRRGEKLIGENTDGRGFVTALRTLADPAGASVVMFGAGGAARAVAVELALAGARSLVVVNRSRGRAEPLVELLNARTKARAEFAPWLAAFRVPRGADIVINATSIGLYPDLDGRLDLDLDFPRSLHGRGRPHPEPAKHPVPARRGGARLPDAGRSRHAGEPGGDRNQVLDRGRRRPRHDARRAFQGARRLVEMEACTGDREARSRQARRAHPPVYPVRSRRAVVRRLAPAIFTPRAIGASRGNREGPIS